MKDLENKIKNLKFDKKILQKRQADILDSIQRLVPLPSDELDLFVLQKALPEITLLDETKITEIEEWLKEQE